MNFTRAARGSPLRLVHRLIDLVNIAYHKKQFANKSGKALDRHNLLHRHVKPVAERLGLPKTIDFENFRTMHASLMRRYGARLEVARDNMGHAGSTGSITLDVYLKT